MRLHRAGVFATLLFAALLTPPRSAVAEGDQTVIARVGKAELTVADVQQRLQHVPTFQLRTYGKSPREIRRNFVEKVMIPEMLYAQEAERRKLDESPRIGDRVRAVLRSAMLKSLEAEVEKQHPITDKQVLAYYASHSARFNTPPRIRIWRILVADKAAAEKILAHAKGTKGPEAWGVDARRDSLDKATAMRNGDVGFVRPDGRTETPRVRVDPALYAAAQKVKDGELVPEPVREGDQWAVVWRRGSMPAVNRTVKQEAGSIRQILSRQRMKDATTKLVHKLDKQHVSEVNERLLQYLDLGSPGDVGARQRPGLLPRRRPVGSPTPQQTEHGLR